MSLYLHVFPYLHIKVKGNLSYCVCKCIFLDIVLYQASWVYSVVMMVDDGLGLLMDILFNSHVLGLYIRIICRIQ